MKYFSKNRVLKIFFEKKPFKVLCNIGSIKYFSILSNDLNYKAFILNFTYTVELILI